jgi:hypothetical protein
VQDGSNPDGNQWGPYVSLGSTTNVDPDGNLLTDNNNTAFNTNNFGTSRTGDPPYTLSYSGHWIWSQSNGSATGEGWVDDRQANRVLSMTINAVPEPAGLAGIALAGAALVRRRRAR